jgi:hypothetical protein
MAWQACKSEAPPSRIQNERCRVFKNIWYVPVLRWSRDYRHLYILVKGKAVPLQAWGGPEGSRKLRFPYFLTTAQDGGKVVSLTYRPHLPQGNTPGTHRG